MVGVVGSPGRVGRGSSRLWRGPGSGKEAVTLEVGWAFIRWRGLVVVGAVKTIHTIITIDSVHSVSTFFAVGNRVIIDA